MPLQMVFVSQSQGEFRYGAAWSHAQPHQRCHQHGHGRRHQGQHGRQHRRHKNCETSVFLMQTIRGGLDGHARHSAPIQRRRRYDGHAERKPQGLLPVIAHNFISLGNISNILRYLYGRTHMYSGTTPYKRKCGNTLGNIGGQRRRTPMLLRRVEALHQGILGQYI